MRPALHRGIAFDADELNRSAVARFDPAAAPYPAIIVPGFTPRFGWRSDLHPKNVERLERALSSFQTGLAPVMLVSGGAVHSDDNEAWLMRAWLLDRNVPSDRILIEPHARHSTSNLANAGRMLLRLGASEAVIVSSDTADWKLRMSGWRFAEQSYYFGFPWLSTFHLRCLLEFGHTVGELTWLAPHHVRFRPSPKLR